MGRKAERGRNLIMRGYVQKKQDVERRDVKKE